MVTAEAKEAFDRAVGLDPRDVRSRYFLGLAAEQDGRPKDAATAWRALLAEASANAGWAGFVRQSLGRVEPGADGDEPGAECRRDRGRERNVARAAQHDGPRHGGAARGTIEAGRRRRRGLAALLRAYMVLGDKEQARAAAEDARRALTSDPEKLRRIDDLIKGLGLEG